MISLLCPFGIPGLGITFTLPGKLLDLLPISWSEEEEPLFDEDEDEDEEDSSPEVVDASTESFHKARKGVLILQRIPGHCEHCTGYGEVAMLSYEHCLHLSWSDVPNLFYLKRVLAP